MSVIVNTIHRSAINKTIPDDVCAAYHLTWVGDKLAIHTIRKATTIGCFSFAPFFEG
jgi:hypothetical protein